MRHAFVFLRWRFSTEPWPGFFGIIVPIVTNKSQAMAAIASASGTEDPGSNSVRVRVYGF
jgi:hypothetical protein